MPLSPTDTQRVQPEPPPSSPQGPTASRPFGALLTVAGFVGLVNAAVLLVEKIELIKNPDYVPTCSINPVLSCGSVMTTPQAEAFGIPNPILGIAGFAAVAAIGLAVLAGAAFHRWFWMTLQAGVTFGVLFVHWLIYQSLYEIGALCPYCIVVWIVTIALFVHTTAHNLRPRTPPQTGLQRAVDKAVEYRGPILTGWYLVLTVLIAVRFWDYWTTLV